MTKESKTMSDRGNVNQMSQSSSYFRLRSGENSKTTLPYTYDAIVLQLAVQKTDGTGKTDVSVVEVAQATECTNR